MQGKNRRHACPVHFVGSVPLESAPAVMESLAAGFPDGLTRIPDGETGERTNWIVYQEDVIRRIPGFELVAGTQDARSASMTRPQRGQFRLDPTSKVDAGSFGPLGYASAAIASYRDFERLREQGRVPAKARYMVALPSPYNIISFSIHPDSQAAVEPAYEARLLAELDEILAAVPHERLSLQWDCAHDMQAFDGARKAWFAPAREGIIERLVRLGNRIPEGAELGYHLCYGNYGGRHFVEPQSTAAMVELSNGIIGGLTRKLDFLHMPVPIERDDDAYFAPLRQLALPEGCELFLGLIHDRDGLAGTMRRHATARRHLDSFGIATECGFGRRPPEDVPMLLELHRAAAAAATDAA
jgi:hypothetical protein